MSKTSSRKVLPARSFGALLAVWAFFAFYACGSKAQEAAQGGNGAAITSSIDASQIGAPISKYLYGGFIEHGGMLDGVLQLAHVSGPGIVQQTV